MATTLPDAVRAVYNNLPAGIRGRLEAARNGPSPTHPQSAAVSAYYNPNAYPIEVSIDGLNFTVKPKATVVDGHNIAITDPRLRKFVAEGMLAAKIAAKGEVVKENYLFRPGQTQQEVEERVKHPPAAIKGYTIEQARKAGLISGHAGLEQTTYAVKEAENNARNKKRAPLDPPPLTPDEVEELTDPKVDTVAQEIAEASRDLPPPNLGEVTKFTSPWPDSNGRVREFDSFQKLEKYISHKFPERLDEFKELMEDKD